MGGFIHCLVSNLGSDCSVNQLASPLVEDYSCELYFVVVVQEIITVRDYSRV